MLRRTPLKRTPFKAKLPARPPREERAPRPLPSIDPSRFRLPTAVTGMATPVRKTEYVRSKALREAYRLIPCQGCGAQDGTVCCAHANEGQYGKGMGIKACDTRGASLCFRCHSRLDQGSDWTQEQRRAFWHAAHVKSVRLLVSLGHWPKEIPVPNPNEYEQTRVTVAAVTPAL